MQAGGRFDRAQPGEETSARCAEYGGVGRGPFDGDGESGRPCDEERGVFRRRGDRKKHRRAISSGSKLFIANCAMCHGESGEGDGPASAGMDPKPAALSDGELLSDLSDAYLYWRIAEGGSADSFKSAMPVWKSIFGDEQIWQLVTFIRSFSN